MTEPGVCTLNGSWAGNEDRELLGLGLKIANQGQSDDSEVEVDL